MLLLGKGMAAMPSPYPVYGADSGCATSNITPRESGQTSIWSFLTRTPASPTLETKQMTAVETQAGAVSHKKISDWNAINWRQVDQNVRRLQARIVKATQVSGAAFIKERWKGLS